jgi:hypothetical protein
MNIPPAPLSMSPRVSTLSVFSVLLIEIGIDNEFDLMVASVTEKTSSTGEIDVDAALQFKNPLSQLLGKTPPFLLHSSTL